MRRPRDRGCTACAQAPPSHGKTSVLRRRGRASAPPTNSPTREGSIFSLIFLAGCLAYNASAQTPLRYKNEVFTKLVEAKGIPYATNLNWLYMTTFATDATDPAKAPIMFGVELPFLIAKVKTGKTSEIPMKYRYPRGVGSGDSTYLKVTTLTMDAYMPDETGGPKRPVIIYLHTGNFLPPGAYNGSPCGDKSDSIVRDLCRGFARRGFVAIAIDYRLGWNPVATTLDGRRGTLLNAVYRSMHDVKEAVELIQLLPHLK